MGESRLQHFLDDAARLAIDALHSGAGGPFGAVVVRDGRIIGRGMNETRTTCDPTAHAEIQAIRDACRNLNSIELVGASIYCSAEPCPMCLSAIYWAMIDGVYFSNTKEQTADCGFDDGHIYDELRLDWKARKIGMVHVPNELALESFRNYERLKAEGRL